MGEGRYLSEIVEIAMAVDGELVFTLHKLDDKSAYQMAKRIAALFGITEKVRFRLAPGLEISEEVYNPSNISRTTFSINFFTVGGHSSISKSHVGFTISRHQDGESKKPTDPYYDVARLELGSDVRYWNENPGLPIQAKEIINKDQIPSNKSAQGEHSTLLRELIVAQNSTHQQIMEDLSKSVQSMIAKRAELEAQAALEEQSRKEEHVRALEELDAQRAKLQRQTHMSERRKIASKIAERINQDTLKTMRPKGVTLTAWSVFIATVLIGLIAAASAYASFHEFSERQSAIREFIATANIENQDREVLPSLLGDLMWSTDWYLIGRMIISSLVSVGFLTYSASWMKKYYDEDMRRQREMERFNNDVLRASWIVEAVQEVKHEGKAELPPEWVEAVTRNMFEGKSPSEQDEGVLALKALMGFAAKTKVGPNGVELEVNRSGVKKMGKASTGEE